MFKESDAANAVFECNTLHPGDQWIATKTRELALFDKLMFSKRLLTDVGQEFRPIGF